MGCLWLPATHIMFGDRWSLIADPTIGDHIHMNITRTRRGSVPEREPENMDQSLDQTLAVRHKNDRYSNITCALCVNIYIKAHGGQRAHNWNWNWTIKKRRRRKKAVWPRCEPGVHVCAQIHSYARRHKHLSTDSHSHTSAPTPQASKSNERQQRQRQQPHDRLIIRLPLASSYLCASVLAVQRNCRLRQIQKASSVRVRGKRAHSFETRKAETASGEEKTFRDRPKPRRNKNLNGTHFSVNGK